MEGEQLVAAKEGKRVRALWELRREEREMKLRLDLDELKYMMEGEQLSAAEGGTASRSSGNCSGGTGRGICGCRRTSSSPLGERERKLRL